MSFSRNLKKSAADMWEKGYQHPFVQQLGAGTLDKSVFEFYLLQDYLYLIEYAKVFAWAAVKSDSEDLLQKITAVQHAILSEEMELHRQYMTAFGISPNRVASVKPALFNRTYTSNMLAVGAAGEVVDILVAILPCAWSYADYASRLKQQYQAELPGNFYKTWIEEYSSPEFIGAYEWVFEAIDRQVEKKGAKERERITETFISSVEFEYLFWEMAYKKELSYQL